MPAGQQQRADVHVPDPAGLPLLGRESGDGGELPSCDRAGARPQDAVSRRVVLERHRRRGRRPGRQGQDTVGREGQRRSARDHADPTRARLPVPDRDALLLRRSRKPAHRPTRRHEIPGQARTTSPSSTRERRSSCDVTPTTAANGRSAGTRSRSAQNVDMQTSYLQVRRGDIDLDIRRAPTRRPYGTDEATGSTRAATSSTPAWRSSTSRSTRRDRSSRTGSVKPWPTRSIAGADAPAGLNGGGAERPGPPTRAPGYRAVTVFPNRPNMAKARALMRGRKAKAVLYAGNDPVSDTQAEIIRHSLGAVGIDVEVKTFPFAVQIPKAGPRGEPFDMNLIGWFADYPDPYDFINVLLYGKTIAKLNNVNTAYFDDPVFNRRMEAQRSRRETHGPAATRRSTATSHGPRHSSSTATRPSANSSRTASAARCNPPRPAGSTSRCSASNAKPETTCRSRPPKGARPADPTRRAAARTGGARAARRPSHPFVSA